MVKPCPIQRAPCYLAECSAGCKIKREAETKPHGIFCTKQGAVCWAPMCITARQCGLRKETVVSEDNKVLINGKRYRICPSGKAAGMSNICTDLDCVEQNECMWEFGEAAIGNAASDNGGAHVCPKDNSACTLMSCAGGKDCVAQLQIPGGVPHSSYVPGGVVHVPYKDCHTGMLSIGFLKKAEILLGRETAAKNWQEDKDGKLGLIIGLLGDPYPQSPQIGVNDTAKKLGADVLNIVRPNIPNIWIKWPDYGIVPFDRAWWGHLVSIIAEVDGCVLIYCIGGHGRTGTAASIIATLGGLVPDGACPVTWLRSVYCKNVVESESQLGYVEKITGRKVTADASKHVGVPYTYSGHGSHQKKTLKRPSGLSYGNGPPAKSTTKKPNSRPQRLSIKKWKQWWRGVDKRGIYAGIATITRPKDIPDGFQFIIGRRTWIWRAAEHVFEERKNADKASK